MECAGNTTYDSFTRYRTAATTAVGHVARWDDLEKAALLVAISMVWGYIAYVALAAVA